MKALPKSLVVVGLTMFLFADFTPRAGALSGSGETDSANPDKVWQRQNGQQPGASALPEEPGSDGPLLGPYVPRPTAGPHRIFQHAPRPPSPVARQFSRQTVEPALVLACGNGVTEQMELLTNGDFETGSLAGWTVDNQPLSAGTFIVDTPGTTVPTSGNPTAPNPGGGAFYAVTDMGGPGTHAISQAFTVPAGANQVTLKFEMFVDDWSGLGPIVNVAGLDHTAIPNQHARVDLLAAGSPPFDTVGGVIATYYLGVDPGPTPNAYTSYSFDLSAVTAPGGSYVIRFAGVETVFYQHVGVDNVTVVAAETCDPPGAPAGQPDECRADCSFCGDGLLDQYELLANGNFEAGSLAGWAVDNQPGSGGTFIVDTPGTTVPTSMFATSPNAGGGAFYAVTDMGGAGTHAISQSFTVPVSATQVTLRFEMFVDDHSGAGPIVNVAGLTHTAGPNQHARVDLLAAGSPPFETGAGVIATYYLNVDPGASPHAYTSYSFDLSAVTAPGGTYVIRFAGVETVFYQHVGVDNVSVIAKEECDDGNNVPGDGCGADCTVEACGDSTIDFGETCDPPGVPPGLPNECRADCSFCGDAILDPATNLLTNGDFEAGSFAGWTVADLGAGTFIVDTPGTTVPTSGNPTALNPGGGAFYAVTDMNNPGTHALLQSFTVPAGASKVTLTFEMFVDDWSGSGGIVNPAGLDHTAIPNQHARVDLLAAGSPLFATGAGVLANFYLGVDPGASPHPYRSYSFNLTGIALPGMTYIIRFAEVDTQGFHHLGVDNVRIIAGEECDDGNNVNGDGCSAICRIECGDGVVGPNEQCDDGNMISGDGCSASCALEFCGDGVVQPALGETCDPPGVPPGQPNVCRSDCTFCGDGITDPVPVKELLSNGNFEAGGFAGWQVANMGAGAFFVDTPGTTTPVSLRPTAANPGGGAFYAVTDMNNPGTHALLQSFTVPIGAIQVTLRFEMFVNDWSGSGGIVNPAGLDHTAIPNQHARVDLLAAGSPPFDTGPGVLANFYLGVDPGALPNPYQSYSFDLTGVALPGGTYLIRFAGVENGFIQHVGVDNVSVAALVEECDDGNNVSGDGCSAVCDLEVCGDGMIDFGETCDPPGVPPGLPNECRSDCSFCGDAILDPAADLLFNGNFETGGFAGWLVADQPGSAGTFIVDTPGTTVPSSGNPTAPNPGGGLLYAVTDMGGPGTHALLQTFTVPAGASQVTLTFEMFVDDWSGSAGIVNPAGLDHTAIPNQHARVDLLAAGSPPFDTGAGVLANFYLGVDPGTPPHPYRTYSFDLTGVALPGGTYLLRFAGVETEFFLHVGVDNVRIVAAEECDDGNNVSGDGCSAICKDEKCGNGVIDGGELCDPPGPLPGGSDCCADHPGTGCTDPVCQDLVCDQSPSCCGIGWSAACAALANSLPQCVSGCTSVTQCTPQCCIDSDGDGTCDAADNCPLTPNIGGGGTALLNQPVLAINNVTFAWSMPADIQWVMGDLATMGTYMETASGSASAATTLPAPGVPPVGTGFWWIVKPDCSPGSWSTGTPGECAPPGVCPPGGRDGNLPPN